VKPRPTARLTNGPPALVRTGLGFDIHPFAAGRRLVLGGVQFRQRLGLAGHSDADVLCHAVADALLGAVADGDIGRHFPDTDPAWKNSLRLLQAVAERVRRKGAVIVCVDATVLAEQPRIAPRVATMRARLARALGIRSDRVSIKATTLERLGALGRKEGIAALAVATVQAQS